LGEHCALVFPDDVVDGKPDAGVGHVDDDVDLVDVEPLPRDRGANVRLVLVIAGNDVDLPALGQKAGILDRHLSGQRRAGAAEIGVKPGLIGERTDFHGLVLRDGESCGRAGQRGTKQHRRNNLNSHICLPFPAFLIVVQTPR
jgi:hypothetical protein